MPHASHPFLAAVVVSAMLAMASPASNAERRES